MIGKKKKKKKTISPVEQSVLVVEATTNKAFDKSNKTHDMSCVWCDYCNKTRHTHVGNFMENLQIGGVLSKERIVPFNILQC